MPKLVGTGNGSPCGIMVYEGELLPRNIAGPLLEGRRRHAPRSTSSRSTGRGRVPDAVQGLPWCVATRGSGRSMHVQYSMGRYSWPTGTTRGSAAMRSGDQTTGRIYRVAPLRARASQKVKVDFASSAGLIAALKSPNIATQDAARRGLIAFGEPKARNDVGTLSRMRDSRPDLPTPACSGSTKAHAIDGDSVAMAASAPGS